MDSLNLRNVKQFGKKTFLKAFWWLSCLMDGYMYIHIDIDILIKYIYIHI